MNTTAKILSAAILASVAGIGTAHAVESNDLFVLKSGAASQHISYDESRKVRICLDNTEATRPLKVSHGLGTNIIEPGSCYSFESSEFRVSARGIKGEFQMVGRVEQLD